MAYGVDKYPDPPEYSEEVEWDYDADLGRSVIVRREEEDED
jgi:hypothetical protein